MTVAATGACVDIEVEPIIQLDDPPVKVSTAEAPEDTHA
jgi:hypothetical protein